MGFLLKVCISMGKRAQIEAGRISRRSEPFVYFDVALRTPQSDCLVWSFKGLRLRLGFLNRKSRMNP